MNCSEASRLLYDFLNRELDRLNLDRVKSHLRSCPSCTRIFEFERRFQEFLVDRIPKETAPPQLRSAILDRIYHLEEPRAALSSQRKRPFSPPAIVLAPIALVAVFLAIVLFTSRANHEDPFDVLVENHIQAGSSTGGLTYSSSDPQFVSSHLERELGFQASLTAYATSGVILRGGGVIPVCNCKVGQVYFSRGEVGISLFICNRGEVACPEAETISHDNREYRFASIRGFNLLFWEEGEQGFIALSTLPKGTLLGFASRRA